MLSSVENMKPVLGTASVCMFCQNHIALPVRSRSVSGNLTVHLPQILLFPNI